MKDKISILDCKTSVTLIPKEGFIVSLFRDLSTLAIIAFCVYISKDSTWWTFVTGGMFLFLLIVNIKRLVDDNTSTFTDIDKAIKYLESKKQ